MKTTRMSQLQILAIVSLFSSASGGYLWNYAYFITTLFSKTKERLTREAG
jgi:hypothetical protein